MSNDNNICGRIIILSDIPGGFVDDGRIVGEKNDHLLRRQLDHYDNETSTTKKRSAPKGIPVSPCDNSSTAQEKGTKNQVRSFDKSPLGSPAHLQDSAARLL